MSLRRRLFRDLLVVLLLGMALAGMLVWRAAETLYLDTQRENLLALARLSAAALEGLPLPEGSGSPYQQTANTAPGIHTRLISEQGGVVLDLSGGQPQAAPAAEGQVYVSSQDLSRREEIASAQDGVAAAAVRSVAGRRVLYAAAPIYGANGEVAGLVYLAMPLPPGGLPPEWLLPLAGAGLLAVGLTALVAGWAAREVSRPVERVARAAAVVSRGDLGQRLESESSIHELAELAEAFNAMIGSLRRSETAKNAFVADVTHELRTPLTVIKGTIETLQDGALEDREGRGPLLEAMQRETERLIRLVNDLLVLTRADAGALRLDLGPVDLGELARLRLEGFSTAAEKRGVRLTLDAPAPAWVKGDSDRLAQVLDNLLDNALRFSPQIGCVSVIVSRERDGWTCRVTDQGPGIPPEHLERVFERFYRVEPARDRRSGGAGLGLAIARSLINAQGGEIGAESPPEGGASVWFWLPVNENELAAAARLPES